MLVQPEIISAFGLKYHTNTWHFRLLEISFQLEGLDERLMVMNTRLFGLIILF